MPVSMAVCETANVVNAALRESLGVGNGSRAADEAKKTGGGGGDDSDSEMHNQIAVSAYAKRILMSKIEYEEVPNYHDSVLEQLKNKYIVIKQPSNNNNSSSCNGSNFGNSKVVGANGHDNGNNGHRKLTQSESTQSGPSPNELPKPKRVLYPRENIRIGWKQSERKWQVGTGMINVGNTCYLNSTLQALFHIPALANWLVSEQTHLENCNITESNGGCIICAMAKTLQSTQSCQSAMRPFHIYSKLKQICKHMVVGRQEDAHEFLRFLVEAMEKAYLMRFRNFKELDQLVKETTPLNQIFGGYLRSEVRCLSCSHVSITFQHFQDLLLDIRKSDTLEEAFDGYFSRERLEDMGYKCEGCKKKVSATKQFSLERAPITLCIQLKRFSMIGNKLTKTISFKPRIDLSRFAARSPAAAAQPLTYRLVSMVTHLGVSQHCGHYTAIGMTESGSYYNFDDSYVRPIAMQSVCNTNAYIMFYELDLSQTTPLKSNGLRLTNGHSQVAVPATVSSSSPTHTRFIGPQLPPGGINGYSNGHATGSSNAQKTAIQFKQQQQHPQQNGLQVGTGKFQEPPHAKSPLAGAYNKGEAFPATTANGNKSSSSSASNSNHNKSVNQLQHQQHYLPISSEDEDSEDGATATATATATARPTAQLPSMPKMTEDSSDKPKTPLKSSVKTNLVKSLLKTPLKSLVPYESASEEDEPLPNPRKRRSDSDSNDSGDSDPQPGHVNGHTKTNGGSLTNGNGLGKAKTILATSSSSSLASASASAASDDEDADEEEENSKLTNGWQPQKQSQSLTQSKAPPSPKTPPSPAVIKSKTGIWKVTRNDDNEDEDDDDDEDEEEQHQVVSTPSKNPRNPFAKSSTTPGAKRQKLLNGIAVKSQQQPRVGNGYQSEASTNGNVVNELLKQTHRGYGSASVLSWSGKPAELEKELVAEAREQRQHDHDDEEENEMDRGRQRKVKSATAKAYNSSTPGYNPFQEYESQKRWHKSSNGGGSFPRYHNQNFRQNFQQRNKFKYNRFGGPGGAKFQQQRALQRHLASGGVFNRRQPTGQQQQQQSQQSSS
uniref:Ubiquitin carboxyl-terminal hydrolase 36 n=1 Tax=Drosophila pseudoobscura pseudoobscura TaxID=46245 RepID=UBP36_DROPS|nr:RecName: Full=Ubiquitin carboxyl-terminal hydrolase 36; AltName: Full=Deubiquitinating enzyme 36; AltName: Full=Protein scrawny; AltName: Full=Ubiquitin thioesterase 36; AltName: Full=Ubiquitin-specific-processing protease 36 [Drosophila pseudoobscura pseudoobscura]